MSEEYPLPEALRLTPEKLAEAEANQIKWRAASPFAVNHPLQTEMNRAAVFIRDLEAAKENLDASDKGTLLAINQKLAENYAIIGRYDKAFELETDETKRAEYKAFFDAVALDDNDSCNCENQQGDLELSNAYVKAEIFSAKHNKIMPVVACRACGHLNATLLPKEAAKLREARRTARNLVGTMDKERAKDVLRREKMTTADVVK